MIPIVGNSKVGMRDSFVEAIDGLGMERQKKLPKDVKEMYNFLIEDEVAPTSPETPAAAAPIAQEEPKKKEASKKEEKKEEKKKGEAPKKPECEAFGKAQDLSTNECKFCKEKYPEDFKACSKLMTKNREKELSEKKALAKYTRAHAFLEAMRAGPATLQALAKRSDNIYAEKRGKTGNLREAMWANNYYISVLRLLEIITVDEQNVLHLDEKYMTK
jgi:outer membrane biosynthesis protein TonB